MCNILPNRLSNIKSSAWPELLDQPRDRPTSPFSPRHQTVGDVSNEPQDIFHNARMHQPPSLSMSTRTSKLQAGQGYHEQQPRGYAMPSEQFELPATPSYRPNALVPVDLLSRRTSSAAQSLATSTSLTNSDAVVAARHAQEQSHRMTRENQGVDAVRIDELEDELLHGPLSDARMAEMLGARAFSTGMYKPSKDIISKTYVFEANGRFLLPSDPMHSRSVLIVQSRHSSSVINPNSNTQQRLQESLVIAIKTIMAARSVAYTKVILVHVNRWCMYTLLSICKY